MNENKKNPYLKNVTHEELSQEEIQAQKIKEFATNINNKNNSNPFDLKSHLQDMFKDVTDEEKEK